MGFIATMIFIEQDFFLLNPYNSFEMTSQPGVAYESVAYIRRM